VRFKRKQHYHILCFALAMPNANATGGRRGTSWNLRTLTRSTHANQRCYFRFGVKAKIAPLHRRICTEKIIVVRHFLTCVADSTCTVPGTVSTVSTVESGIQE
jgi:hypothetical protein